MPITTFTPTDEEIQKMRAQNRVNNLRDEGELESNPEAVDTNSEADKPHYIQHNSKEEAENYQKTVSKIIKEGLYLPSDQEKREEVIDNTADAVEAFINSERSKNIELGEKAIIGGEIEKKPHFVIEPENPVQGIFMAENNINQDLWEAKTNNKEDYKTQKLVDFPLLFGLVKEGVTGLLEKISIKGIFEFTKGVFGLFAGAKNGAEALTPEQQAEKRKKAERAANQKKFYDALAAQGSARPSVEFQMAEKQEKEQVNTIGKIGHALYSGIKDSFGRMTAYATALFDQGQKDAELARKKAEKQASLQKATQESQAAQNARSLDKVDGQSGIVGANASAG